MRVLLRVSRIVAFIGKVMLFLLVLVFRIPFLKIWSVAFHSESFTDYCFLVIMILSILYPLLFLITILYMKLNGWHVYLIYGKGELSLWGLFWQNELIPFFRFLTASPISYNKPDQHLRFPYNVDFGYENRKVLPHWVWVILAFLYRAARAIVFLAIIIAVVFFATYYLQGRI